MNLVQRLADHLLEMRIANAANQDMNIPSNWAQFVDLVNQRSPEQVARMESESGLNAN